jgi:hypothetical protein
MKKLMCCVLLCISTSVAAFDQELNSVAEQNIKTFKMSQSEPGDIQCGVQKLPIHQLNNTIGIQVFTLTECGGGNHAEQYVMVLTKHTMWKTAIISLVGNDMGFTADFIRTNSSNIFTLYGSVLMENDAHCCPSGKTHHTYQWKNNKLYTK